MTRARVVWRIPQSVHDECPLPEPWFWQDEDTNVFAALKHPDEGPFAWLWDYQSELIVRFKDDRKYVPFPKGEKEQALRFMYAQFLFNGPTT
jgi:hypothetical protein